MRYAANVLRQRYDGSVGLSIYLFEGLRVGRHAVHRFKEETSDIPTLLPPHYRASLLLPLLLAREPRRLDFLLHELLRPCDHVLLLRINGGEVQAEDVEALHRHCRAALPNDRRRDILPPLALRLPLAPLVVQEVSRQPVQPNRRRLDVQQLPIFVREVRCRQLGEVGL